MPSVQEALLRLELVRLGGPDLRLYESQEYVSRAERKVRRLKKIITRCHIAEVMPTMQFIVALRRIDETFPDDGGWEGLNSLVACRHVLNPEG